MKSHSQHRVCESCGRSFECAHAPQFFLQQLPGLVRGLRRLGHRDRGESVGVDPQSTTDTHDGALLLWPNIHREVSQWMLQALSLGARIPLDVPFDDLDARHQMTLRRHSLVYCTKLGRH